MSNSSFIFLFTLFILSGCSYFSNRIDTLAQGKPQIPDVTYSKVNYCTEKSRYHYFTEDELTLKFFRTVESSILNKDLPFVQKGIALALTELNRRPDQVSPSSRLQVYLKLDGKIHYFDFRPKDLEDDTKASYIKGLDHLAKTFLRGQTLASTAAMLDSSFPQQFPVSHEFEDFLKDQKNELQKSELQTARFFKGDETLTRYETYHRMSFKNIVNFYTSPQFSSDDKYEYDKNGLFPLSIKNNFAIKCNTKLERESTFSDEILSSENKKTNSIGFVEGENIFLAVSSAILQKPLHFEKNFFYLKMRPSSFPAPVCEFSDEHKKIVLFSVKGRGPGQHLKHLISYEIDQVTGPKMLNELLKFSRHIFLPDPDRILYESKRGRKAQLDFFLAMNFPIYHVNKLGEIFGTINYAEEKQQKLTLIVDDRNATRLSCQK